jgi:hypothetical protein
LSGLWIIGIVGWTVSGVSVDRERVLNIICETVLVGSSLVRFIFVEPSVVDGNSMVGDSVCIVDTLLEVDANDSVLLTVCEMLIIGATVVLTPVFSTELAELL